MSIRPTTAQACDELFDRDVNVWQEFEMETIAEQDAAGVEDDMTCAVCGQPLEAHPSYPSELKEEGPC